MAKLSAKNQVHYDNTLPKLQSTDWSEVRAGIHQLAALNIPILLRHLATGISQRRGALKLKAGCWVEATVDAAHRKNAALAVAALSGKLDAVTDLDLRGYTDLPPLGRLAGLRNLTLDESVTDLSPLAGLELDALTMYNTKVIDLRPLAALKALKALNLTGATELADLTGLEQVSGLSQLQLNRTQKIQSLATLTAISGLESLQLQGSAVEDLSGLAGMAKLTVLDLQGATALRLSSSVPLPQVEKLMISNAKATDLPLLGQLPGLTWLDAENLPITSLDAIAACPLNHLNLRGCKAITSFAPLAGMAGLTYLRLWETQISDLSPLSGLTAMEYLDLDTTQISDIAPLRALAALKTLDIRRCPNLDQTISRPWSGAEIATLLARYPAPV